MKHLKTKAFLATGLALALAACGDDPEVEEIDDTAVISTEPVETAEFDPMTRDYELSEEAQARRDEFDDDAFQTEYAGYRDEMSQESGGQMAGDDMDSADADTTTMNGETGTMTSGDSGSMGGMMERSAMNWNYLDRNSDGQLSAAEYAIWAVPLDPTQPLPDDETAPYLTAEQINSTADSFFYYDTDGDTFLSQSEFMVARRGDDVTAM